MSATAKIGTRTQAELERQYRERKARVDRGDMTPEAAYANMDDWLLQLGPRQAVLLGPLGQWLWYDPLHKDWVFAGCGVEEGILVVFGKTGGMKRLPRSGPVDDWCIVQVGEQLVGPLQLEELRRMIVSRQVPQGSRIWNPTATQWFDAADPIGQAVLARAGSMQA